MKLKIKVLRNAALIVATLAVVTGTAEARGVTDDTIVIGTVQDMSGPLAALGQRTLNGMLMRVDEINASGGINGRMIDLEVADSGYQPQRALLATQRMVQRKGIFAMVGELGSVTSMASIPVLLKNNVPSLFPLSGAEGTYLPTDPLKWSSAVPYAAQIRAGEKYLVGKHDYNRVCVIYQNDEFGTAVLRGAKEGLSDLNKKMTESVSFQRGETNFTAGVSKLKSANCDLVVIGAALREPVAIMRAARKLGWSPQFLSSSASYSIELPRLAGDLANGFYAISQVEIPYENKASSPELENWAKAYSKEYGKQPDVFSVYGYSFMDTFALAARNAGKELTVESLIAALKKLKINDDMFGASYDFSKKEHMGGTTVRMFEVLDGKWQPASKALDLAN